MDHVKRLIACMVSLTLAFSLLSPLSLTVSAEDSIPDTPALSVAETPETESIPDTPNSDTSPVEEIPETPQTYNERPETPVLETEEVPETPEVDESGVGTGEDTEVVQEEEAGLMSTWAGDAQVVRMDPETGEWEIKFPAVSGWPVGGYISTVGFAIYPAWANPYHVEQYTLDGEISWMWLGRDIYYALYADTEDTQHLDYDDFFVYGPTGAANPVYIDEDGYITLSSDMDTFYRFSSGTMLNDSYVPDHSQPSEDLRLTPLEELKQQYKDRYGYESGDSLRMYFVFWSQTAKNATIYSTFYYGGSVINEPNTADNPLVFGTEGTTTDLPPISISGSGEYYLELCDANIIMDSEDGQNAFDVNSIDIASGATVHLTIRGTCNLVSGQGKAGIHVPEGVTLDLILADGAVLNVSSGDNLDNANDEPSITDGVTCAGAAIGGDGGEVSGDIHIRGNGTVVADSGDGFYYGAAGIGTGGLTGKGRYGYLTNSPITIDGVTLTATGSDRAYIAGAGIGGGSYASGVNISVSGGTVTATGGQGTYGAAGIGGGAIDSSRLDETNKGNGTEGYNISVSGGTVTAKASAVPATAGGAGIGGGNFGQGHDIALTGGKVTAYGTQISNTSYTALWPAGAGIGGGGEGDGYNISVSCDNLTTYSDFGGAGIGGGVGGDGYSISVTGGQITCDQNYLTGPEYGGAGIGGGRYGNGYDIQLVASDSFVSAKVYGGGEAAGIGGGYAGNGTDITIQGTSTTDVRNMTVYAYGNGAGAGIGGGNSEVSFSSSGSSYDCTVTGGYAGDIVIDNACVHADGGEGTAIGSVRTKDGIFGPISITNSDVYAYAFGYDYQNLDSSSLHTRNFGVGIGASGVAPYQGYYYYNYSSITDKDKLITVSGSNVTVKAVTVGIGTNYANHFNSTITLTDSDLDITVTATDVVGSCVGIGVCNGWSCYPKVTSSGTSISVVSTNEGGTSYCESVGIGTAGGYSYQSAGTFALSGGTDEDGNLNDTITISGAICLGIGSGPVKAYNERSPKGRYSFPTFSIQDFASVNIDNASLGIGYYDSGYFDAGVTPAADVTPVTVDICNVEDLTIDAGICIGTYTNYHTVDFTVSDCDLTLSGNVGIGNYSQVAGAVNHTFADCDIVFSGTFNTAIGCMYSKTRTSKWSDKDKSTIKFDSCTISDIEAYACGIGITGGSYIAYAIDMEGCSLRSEDEDGIWTVAVENTGVGVGFAGSTVTGALVVALPAGVTGSITSSCRPAIGIGSGVNSVTLRVSQIDADLTCIGGSDADTAVVVSPTPGIGVYANTVSNSMFYNVYGGSVYAEGHDGGAGIGGAVYSSADLWINGTSGAVITAKGSVSTETWNKVIPGAAPGVGTPENASCFLALNLLTESEGYFYGGGDPETSYAAPAISWSSDTSYVNVNNSKLYAIAGLSADGASRAIGPVEYNWTPNNIADTTGLSYTTGLDLIGDAEVVAIGGSREMYDVNAVAVTSYLQASRLTAGTGVVQASLRYVPEEDVTVSLAKGYGMTGLVDVAGTVAIPAGYQTFTLTVPYNGKTAGEADTLYAYKSTNKGEAMSYPTILPNRDPVEEINVYDQAYSYARYLDYYHTHNVTFHSQGGSEIDPNPQVVDYGCKAVKPDDPTREFYAFGGWYTEETCENAYDFSTVVVSDTDLYAKWNNVPVSYTVKYWFETLDGTGDETFYEVWADGETGKVYELRKTDTGTANAGEYITKTAEALDLVYLGYHSVDPDGYSLFLTEDGLVLNIYLDRDVFTVTYDSDGGTEVPDTTVLYQGIAPNPTITKQGYTFVGWYTEDGALYNFQTPVTSDLALTAKWIASTSTLYIVCYRAQAVSGDVYEILEDRPMAGTTGETVTAQEYVLDGFVLNEELSETQGVVLADGSLKLWVYYDRIPHTVHFETNGGTEVSDLTVRHGAILNIPVVTKENCNFAGWFTDEALTVAYNFSSPVTQDMTLYAKWTAMTANYTVQHYKQDLEGEYYLAFEDVITDAVVGSEVSAAQVEYPGFTESETYPERVVSGIVAKDGSLVLKRFYTRNTYRVTFETNGGKAVSSVSVPYMGTISVPSTTRDGYDFAGWYTDVSLTLAFDSNTAVTRDMTLYAKWVTPSAGYTIQHYKEDLSGEYYLASETVYSAEVGTRIVASPNTYTGFTANTAHEDWLDSGVVVKDGSLVLKFFYSRVSYTVTYMSDGDVTQAQVVYEGQAPMPTPTKDGKVFIGWFTDEACTIYYDPNAPVLGDLTLYAKWGDEPEYIYSVHYLYQNVELTAYEAHDDRTYTDKLGTVITITPEEKEGFSFNDVLSTCQGVVLADGSLELWVYYDRKTFTVTYGPGDGEQTETVPYQGTISLTDPIKDGYDFQGWFLDEYLTVPYDPSTPVTGELTLYPKWEEVYVEPVLPTYTVHYLVQNLKRTEYETSYNVTLTGAAGETVTVEPEQKTGFVVGDKSVLEGIVTEDNSLELWVYYDRVTFFVTYMDESVPNADVSYGDTATYYALSKEGYSFGGWYTDEALTLVYNFTTPVTSDLTLWPKWTTVSTSGGGGGGGSVIISTTKVETYYLTVEASEGGAIYAEDKTTEVIAPVDVELHDAGDTFYFIPDNWWWEIGDVEVDGKSVGAVESYSFDKLNADHTLKVDFQHTCYSEPYSDVNQELWYHYYVDWAIYNGYFIGYSDATWGPDNPILRGEVATVIARMKGYDANTMISTPFTDVGSGQYWDAAIGYDYQNGYMIGVSDTQFAPEAAMTREQFALLLYRLAGEPKDFDRKKGSTYSDAGDISSWAETAVYWAVATETMVGDDKNQLLPQSPITRAAAAAMLERFSKHYDF